MTHVLQIDASATMAGSVSRAATAHLVADLHAETVTYRDLAVTSLPHVTEHWVKARLVPAQEASAADQDALALSDALIAELEAADTIVIGLPVYNFTLPAALKAWIDLVARPQKTFRYTADGPIGLLKGKKVIVAYASGGVPMGSPMDFATPYLRHFLGFIGLTDVTFVVAADVQANKAA